MAKVRWEQYDGGGLDVGFVVDHASQQLHTVYHQDPSHILTQNAFRRNTEDNSARRRRGDMYQVAEIPLGIVMEWKTKHGVDIHDVDHWPKVKELLHSPEYSAVRVSESNFLNRPVRTHFAGSRVRASHPLASNRAKFNGGTGGLIHTGVF